MTIHYICVPVANASRSAPQGEAVRGWYKVQGDRLVMCSEDGTPTGKEKTLAPGDRPDVIAARVLKRTWEDSAPSDFHRELSYERWVY